MIRFACPGCSATFTVGDEKAGKSGKCPKCQSQFVIPAADGATGSGATPASADVPSSTEPQPLPPSARADNPPAAPPLPSADPNQPVEIQPCPKCNTRLTVMPGDVGFDIQCPSCETVFKALRADAPPPPDTGSKSKSKGSSALVKLGSGSKREEDDEDDRPSRRRSRRDDEDDRPSRRRDNDDDDRPSRRRSRRDDDRDRDDRDDEDDRPSRRRSRRSRRDDDDDYGHPRRPSEVQTLGILLLVGGIGGVLAALGAAGGSTGICCFWPGTYYELVYGIMAIVKGSQLLGQNDPPDAPRGMFIMAIICIANLDILNLVLGIVGLNMLNNPALQEYYNRR